MRGYRGFRLVAVLALALVLGGCRKQAVQPTPSKPVAPATFKTAIGANEKPIAGGRLAVAVVADAPTPGLFSEELYDAATDADFMRPAAEPLFATDAAFKITDSGAATLRLDNRAKTATVTIKDAVRWADGRPVTARDYVFAYEMLANPAVDTARYTTAMTDIVGMAAYHAGKAKTISGLTMPDGPDGRRVVIHLQRMRPSFTQSGNGIIWESAAPYHYLKDVPFADLAQSQKIRRHPLFFGPFRMKAVVPGQSVTYAPNRYYYKGVPKLAGMTFSLVSSAAIVGALRAKQFDLALEMPSAGFADYRKLDDYVNLGRADLSYRYLGFKVGHWDAARGKNVMDPAAKMSDSALRRAMVSALDIEGTNTRYFGGLAQTATTLIPPLFARFHAKLAGYRQDVAKANALLDAAGYKRGKDGWRTDPTGKRLTINYAAAASDGAAEKVAAARIRQWRAVGLRVRLTAGRLLEYNNFYDKLHADSKDIDVFEATWGVSSEPSPATLYGPTARYNLTRFVTPTNTRLLAAIDAPAALNQATRVQAFRDWQDYMLKACYVVPTAYRTVVVPVNDRVQNLSIAYGAAGYRWQDITVSRRTR
ncbi:oligopeptide ABC transporter substrate-binding protein [Lacticaseibacillus kribbianus]|uniref:oligopeptide ABC transporter substrate-binding protein n=1 Tax=Lacticaseibacillus kribbianus TaxID=2926292 RepID=UPI001CD34E51|nr:oligopeptide ABC transporter substrate-binding protein [Lacticaseibacillus kribbianus]